MCIVCAVDEKKLLLTVAGSLITDAVKPAAELPLPEVYKPIGATFSTNFSS